MWDLIWGFHGVKPPAELTTVVNHSCTRSPSTTAKFLDPSLTQPRRKPGELFFNLDVISLENIRVKKKKSELKLLPSPVSENPLSSETSMPTCVWENRVNTSIKQTMTMFSLNWLNYVQLEFSDCWKKFFLTHSLFISGVCLALFAHLWSINIFGQTISSCKVS